MLPRNAIEAIWLKIHLNMPTHWALVWNTESGHYKKTDISSLHPRAGICLGHQGKRCPHAAERISFTLSDNNGIHPTKIVFCRCHPADNPHSSQTFQLIDTGIFPGTVKEPKSGYTIQLLEYYGLLRQQLKVTAYKFAMTLQVVTDSTFPESIPVSTSTC